VLVCVLNVLRLIILLLFFTTLFSSFLLFLPTHLLLDLFWVSLQPLTPEPSATTRRRQCRHAVVIGLELHFLQLITRNGHESVHVHLLSTSYHSSAMHTHVHMWMHVVVMYTQAVHVYDMCILHMYLCLYVFIYIYACARSRICVPVRVLSPLSRARHRCHVLPLQSPRRVLG